MHKVIAITIILIIFITLLMVPHANIRTVNISVPLLPKVYSCNYSLASVQKVITCFGGRTFLQYNVTKGVVERIYKASSSKIMIGDIILTYGEPIGSKIDGDFITVYWKAFYIMTKTHRLSPTDIAYVVGVEFLEINVNRWCGFGCRK